MSSRTKLQIANRALQHVGQKRMTSLTEVSKAATEISSCYDMLRQAMLRRNVWTFSIRRAILRAVDTDTLLPTITVWESGLDYAAHSLIARNGTVYIAVIAAASGEDPETSDTWQVWYGARSAGPWDEDLVYMAGELAYTPVDDAYAANDVYLSLGNNNEDVLVPDFWDETVTYDEDETVWFGGVVFISVADGNLNNEPDPDVAPWDVDTAYVSPEQVTYLGNIYQASAPTTGDVPTDGAPWTLIGAADWVYDPDWPGDNWIYVTATTTAPFIPYPLGYGPASETTTGYIYYLPFGYLREAAQNPKAGSNSVLGAPTGTTYNDWLLENGFLLTSDPGPIHFRFAADVLNPGQFDPLFSEGFAAQIGLTVCEPLTQSNTKLGNIAKIYATYINEARTVNAIEKGSEEPAQDDWIQTRR